MMKLFLLIMFLVLGYGSPRADEINVDDQHFLNQLDQVKNPFEDGIPKTVIVQKPVYHPPPPPKPKPKPKPAEVVQLPAMSVQGVMVGEDMHQTIIDGQTVSLQGDIKGAKVIAITKQGVTLLYKKRKFFLSIE